MKAGSIIAGQYQLIAQLGEGGMGSVWRAQRVGWPTEVAVKVIHAVLAQDEGAVARFRREARTAAAMHGPNVVQILDDGVDEASKSPFLVMELLAGETLAERLQRRGRLTPRDTLHIVRQLESVLTTAHEKQVVHRDLKPENVFLTGPADAPSIKVLDFGVAKWGAESVRLNAKTATGSVLGTPFYMSPEQLRDSSRVDYRCDLWSVGVMVFECLTGRRPFDADSLVDLAIQICQGPRPVASSFGPVPAGFDAWFARSAALDPRQRFQSAQELGETLSRVCAAKALVGAFGSGADDATLASPGAEAAPKVAHSIGPLSSTRPAARSMRREHRRLLIAGASALLMGGGAVMIWQGGFSPAREETRSAAALPDPAAPPPAAVVPLQPSRAQAAPMPDQAKPRAEEAARVGAENAPVVSVLPATQAAPVAAAAGKTTSPAASASGAAPAPRTGAPASAPAELGAPTTPAVFAAPATLVAPAIQKPESVPEAKPKPGWDSSFDRTEPKTPRWDPSFDRR